MLSLRDVDRLLQVAVRAARAAGEIQMRSLGKAHKIRFKGEINLVTEVDEASEGKILKIIRGSYPDHDFLTEESGAFNRPSEFRWVIDPLDGTTNYAHAYPLFCTAIGLEHRGKRILGVVYEPNLDQLFVGVRGRGASRNGKKISVSRVSILKRSLLATGFAYNLKTDGKNNRKNNIDHFENFLMKAQAVRRDGVAAVDLCYVACGRYDGFWELGLWPWDTAAASLILEEAGGRVTTFDGSPFCIEDKSIVASNGRIHAGMLDVLEGVSPH